MDKEAQEKMDKLYTDIWFLIKDESQTIKGQVMRMLGYRKLPEDNPPLLKYQSSHKVIAGSNEWHNIDGYNLGAHSQREADIKFYS